MNSFSSSLYVVTPSVQKVRPHVLGVQTVHQDTFDKPQGHRCVHICKEQSHSSTSLLYRDWLLMRQQSIERSAKQHCLVSTSFQKLNVSRNQSTCSTLLSWQDLGGRQQWSIGALAFPLVVRLSWTCGALFSCDVLQSMPQIRHQAI